MIQCAPELTSALLLFVFVAASIFYTLPLHSRFVIFCENHFAIIGRAIIGLYGLHLIGNILRRVRYGMASIHQDIVIDSILLATILLGPNNLKFAVSMIFLRELAIILKYAYDNLDLLEIINQFGLKGPQVIAVTFALTMVLGGFLLSLPISGQNGLRTPFIDALFISVSAVCVTGLACLDISKQFSLFGQTVVMLLIQVGGLGIMTLSACTFLLVGKKLGLRQRSFMLEVFDLNHLNSLRNTVLDIIYFTIVIELIGTLLLSLRYIILFGNFSKGIYFGLFHAVSAFCNAGFALFSNNLESFPEEWGVNLTICALIVAGGLGFSVIRELIDSRFWKFWQPRRDFSLHTKMVLRLTTWLILGGAVMIFFTEYSHGLDNLSFNGKLLAALFQSVTTRTAGFNTINMTILQNTTAFLMMALMFIGGSPGGTAGGIKTTTFGVLFTATKSFLQGKSDIEIMNRKIPRKTIVQSISITLISIVFVSCIIFLLLIVEPHSFLEISFEAISAFGTVGLSLGITPKLTGLGKILIMILMYIGRIGPLTLVLALGEMEVQPNSRYPEEKIIVG
jgi:trk system potassium uptake protein TrkH